MQVNEYMKLKNCEYAVVHQAEDWYESFPDIELTKQGTYLCTFTRATFHYGSQRTILLTRSQDGLNWDAPEVIASPRITKYYSWKFKKQRLDEHDCSKIQQFEDGHLEISRLRHYRQPKANDALGTARSVCDFSVSLWLTPQRAFCSAP